MTIYTALKYVNEQGGIQATRIEDGIYVYLETGTDEHTRAESGEWGSVDLMPSPTLEEMKAEKFADLGAHRYKYERGGTTVSGMAIDTGDTTRLLLTGANERAERDITYSVNFKISNGVWVNLNSIEIKSLATGLSDFVQDCFNREKELSDLIVAAADQAELDAIDITSGWP